MQQATLGKTGKKAKQKKLLPLVWFGLVTVEAKAGSSRRLLQSTLLWLLRQPCTSLTGAHMLTLLPLEPAWELPALAAARVKSLLGPLRPWGS